MHPTHTSEYADMTSYFSVSAKSVGRQLVCLSVITTLLQPALTEKPAQQTVHVCFCLCPSVLVCHLELQADLKASFHISAFIFIISASTFPRLCFFLPPAFLIVYLLRMLSFFFFFLAFVWLPCPVSTV